MSDSSLKSYRSPWFSIIIPVWNRETTVERCVRSIISQDFNDYEIIAVDDGSDDNSIKVLRSIVAPKLIIIEHKKNQGVCAARDTGTKAARGEWFILLDSDDSLLPGSLRRLKEITLSAPPDVGCIGGGYIDDNGVIHPDPLPPEGPFGIEQYLRWLDRPSRTDYLDCYRHQVYQTVSWPRDRRLQSQFHLRVVKHWKMLMIPEPISVIHYDAPNRYSHFKSETWLRAQQMISDLADEEEEMIVEFGPIMRQHAPHWHDRLQFAASMLNFARGNRDRGLRYMLPYLVRHPVSARVWGTILLGLLGPRALAWGRKHFD
jgi:glycosyltransferase involved in cell wall biosynthesis